MVCNSFSSYEDNFTKLPQIDNEHKNSESIGIRMALQPLF